MYGASTHVKTLTTVCSPHHGMKSIDMALEYPGKYPLDHYEKALEAVGVSQKNAVEFTRSNI